jgi:hypothetical protein
LDVFDLKTSFSDSQESGVKVVEIYCGTIFEPSDVGFRDTVGGAVESDAGAFAGDLGVARGDQEDWRRGDL